MTREQKLQCKQIFENYGEKNQLNKATEEAGELIQAIAKYNSEPSERKKYRNSVLRKDEEGRNKPIF